MAKLKFFLLLFSSFFLPSLTLRCTQSLMLDVHVTSFQISSNEIGTLCQYNRNGFYRYQCNIYFEVCNASDCFSTVQNRMSFQAYSSTTQSNLGTRFIHTFTISNRTSCTEYFTIKLKSTYTSSYLSGSITADSIPGSSILLGNYGSSATINVDRRCESINQPCEVKCINGYFQTIYSPYKQKGIGFDQCYYNISIMDSDKSGTHVGTVQAHPEEENYNISCPLSSYGITDGNDDNLFEINNSTGEITLAKDVEPSYSGKVLNITVKATSIENTAFESEALVLIEVKENNCFVPFPNTKHCDNLESFMFSFDTIIANVSEAAPTGTVVRKISTPCQELNSDVSYKILSGNTDRVFDLNRTSGVLSIFNTANLDREVQSQYFLRIQALINGIADVIHVVVNIDDQNDNNPTFDSTSYTFSVYENVPYNTLIGTVKAVDGDADSRITYSFVRQSSTFTLDRTSGKIHLYRNLDSEEKSTYELVVVATDSGANKRQAVVPVTINVLDVNDNKPIFNSSVYNVTIEAGENPRVLIHIHATDSDKNSSIKYYIETGPTNLFRLNQGTGELTTTKTITTPGIYKLKVAAYDGDPFINGEITNYNYATVNVIVHPSLPVVG